ncbi:TetR-like C-terminal domain-containing protein [Actinosynnema pretiosum]|uniref:TetR-like C-terminal domain-containing protein n=1 Tax=Actinosynnema pretiosum TaxID=42197 RepID=UPI001E36FAC9|nr:TetR-like C-terminal domain-containing protein [Actinosynnema pretiosum]
MRDGVRPDPGQRGLAQPRPAARAGVSRPALHRRWPTRLHLVAHVLAESVAPMPDPDTGSAREDLRVLATTLLDALSWVLPAVHAEAGRAPEPGLHERFPAGRHALVAEVVRRGVARGELRGDLAPDPVRDLLLGPLPPLVRDRRGPLGGPGVRPRAAHPVPG